MEQFVDKKSSTNNFFHPLPTHVQACGRFLSFAVPLHIALIVDVVGLCERGDDCCHEVTKVHKISNICQKRSQFHRSSTHIQYWWWKWSSGVVRYSISDGIVGLWCVAVVDWAQGRACCGWLCGLTWGRLMQRVGPLHFGSNIPKVICKWLCASRRSAW